jgi:hypothetical protein
MAAMISRGVPIFPITTAALGALAAAALGAVGLHFFPLQDTSLTVLVWQVGTVLALVGVAGALGPKFLRWPRT